MLVPLSGPHCMTCPPEAEALVARLHESVPRATLVWKCSPSIETWPPISRKGPRVQVPLSGWVHWPLLQTSFVQALPSSAQGAVLFVNTQPVPGLHESSVQTLPSEHVIGVKAQPVAGLQESAVQALPSEQVMGVKAQPVAGLQESAVQALLSEQAIGVNAHPVDGSHEFAVQAS